jgi:murein DD-endopeptidase MepM/ murein hydrolase activator NlpD
MIWPLPEAFISSRYGTLENRVTRHRGLDFRAKVGTSIKAPQNGTIVLNTWSDCLGWCLVLRVWNGKKPMYWGFAHLQKKSKLKVGTKIVEGQRFCLVGNTGACSRGAHLHLTYGPTVQHIFIGATLDPEKVLRGEI